MVSPRFNPGFRLSALDITVLVIASLAAAVLYHVDEAISFCLLFVIGHFFLFCNVFRLPRPLELIWAVVFAASAASTMVWALPGWPLTGALTLLATVVVITIQIRRASYHGVAWQKLNPELPEWFQRHGCESSMARFKDDSDAGHAAGKK